MRGSTLRLLIYLACAFIFSFLGDSWVRAMINEPRLVESQHWFVWLTIFLNCTLQMLLVWRAFLDKSIEREFIDPPKKHK